MLYKALRVNLPRLFPPPRVIQGPVFNPFKIGDVF